MQWIGKANREEHGCQHKAVQTLVSKSEKKRVYNKGCKERARTYWLLCFFLLLQTEIAKRLNAIIAQILPFLSQEHQQQVATAVERAKQVTMTELNAIIGVSILYCCRE